MKKKLFPVTVIIILFVYSCSNKPEIKYPVTKKTDTVDLYFDNEIADPYRWLEDDNSDETAAWVKAQTEVTNQYFEAIPFRKNIEERYRELWNYERYYSPEKVGKYYIYEKNDGLQEQAVVYIQEGLDGEPKVFIDPNKFSEDGTVSLKTLYFSRDHKYCGYAISRSGSDWTEFYVKEVESGKLLDDHLEWIKFSGMAWYKDGFFYSRYDKPDEKSAMKSQNINQKVYYHKVGTSQDKDKLIYQDKKNEKRGFSVSVTDDERFLTFFVWEGSSSENMLYVKDLKKNGKIRKVIGKKEAEYVVVDNIGDKLLVKTNYEAPNYRLVIIDPKKPAKENWKEIIPESEYLLNGVYSIGGKLIVRYLKDVLTYLSVYDMEGKKINDISLPTVGSAGNIGGNKYDKEFFYTFTTYTYPSTIFIYNLEEQSSRVFKKPDIKFDIDEYETEQVFYKSKDGTDIPLFITKKKSVKTDGDNPTILYGYGGFNVIMKPAFRLTMLPFLEQGGIFAEACLRGGGEYGETWHKAGMLHNKQNVFDDFIAGAEYLINEKYTSSEKIAAFGGSNGGTLVGAVINQRPGLFAAAVPAVGVMDMLRFHKFTIGWAWVPEYGSSEDSLQYKTLIKYSPLHNIKSGVEYPAVLVTTADHDDRVFPAHSFKYAAELQAKHTGSNPTLIRIETKAGHGAGSGISKTIELYTDILSFIFYNVDETPQY